MIFLGDGARKSRLVAPVVWCVCVHERSPTATRGNSHCSYGVVLNRLEYVACQYKRSVLMLRLLHRRGDERVDLVNINHRRLLTPRV